MRAQSLRGRCALDRLAAGPPPGRSCIPPAIAIPLTRMRTLQPTKVSQPGCGLGADGSLAWSMRRAQADADLGAVELLAERERRVLGREQRTGQAEPDQVARDAAPAR